MKTHSRTRGGCITCKRKHIKCDETRPECKNCVSKQITCPGYVKPLVWKTTVKQNVPRDSAKKREAVRRPYTRSGAEYRSVSPTVQECERPAVDEQTLQRQSDQGSDTASSSGQIVLDLNGQQTLAFELGNDDSTSLGTVNEDMTNLLMPSRKSKTHSKRLERLQYADIFSQFDVIRNDFHRIEGSPVSFHCAESSRSPTFTAISKGIPEPSSTATWSTQDGIDDAISLAVSQTQVPFPPDDDAHGNELPLFVNDNEQHPRAPWDFVSADECSLNITSLNNGLFDGMTKHDLTMHYFDSVCQILSCFDSHENPFRYDIPRVMLTCDYVHDCVIAMSAAHLANSRTGMESTALKYQARAMAGLSFVIQSMQAPACADDAGIALCSSYDRSVRYQALLTAMMLGISSAWYDPSAASVTHLIGARTLFKAWLLDEGICACTEEPQLLNRQQSFLVGAMAYLECLASFIIDQPFEALGYLRQFGALAERQPVYPNPWTGVSTPLFVQLAETAILMRMKRKPTAVHPVGPQSRSHADVLTGLLTHARRLYQNTLAHSAPAAAMVEDTRDANTPTEDLISIDNIHRLVILMELVQAFPNLAMENDQFHRVTVKLNHEASEMVLDCAIAILTVVSRLPEASGTNVMLSIPLIAAGSALQALPTTPNAPTVPPSLRSSISAITHSEPILQHWRERTQSRLERTLSRVGVAPLRWANQLVQEVWRRADVAISEEGCPTSPGALHWMDIMIEGKYETLFG